MKSSKCIFSMIFIPKIGKLVKTSGKTAQWIAQATDAEMPKTSQFILYFIIRGAKIKQCNSVAKNIFNKISITNIWKKVY